MISSFVIFLNLGALVGAGMLFFEKEASMAVYNMGRALVFSWLSVYLLIRPEKVDFLGALKITSKLQLLSLRGNEVRES